MDTIIRSQPTDTCINEAAEAGFNSPLLDEETLFSSDTGNTLIGLDENGQMNNHNKNNNNVANGTPNSTNIYQIFQQKQPVNSTKLTQNSDPLKTTLPTLHNINTPLPRLQ